MLPVWVVLMVFLTTQISQIFGIMQTLTFMTVKKTWNEASLVCNMNGGYLYKDGSAVVTEAIGIFGDEEPWKSQAYIDSDFWIGLGFSGQDDPAGDPIYIWNNDCGAMDNANDYSDWHPSEPKFPNSRECIYRKRQGNNWNWFTSSCSATKYFICQTDSGLLPCYNPPINDKRGAGLEDEVYPGVTLTRCDDYCYDAKCVAYSFNQATGQCNLYIHYDILHFDDASNQQSDLGYVLYRMGCFEVAVDNTDYGVVNTNSGVDVLCAALENSETTPEPTTTTTTPEPTTTTTIPEPTTTTTTPEPTTTTTTPEPTSTTTPEPTTTTTTPEPTTTTTTPEPTTTTTTPEPTTTTTPEPTTTTTPEPTTTTTPEPTTTTTPEPTTTTTTPKTTTTTTTPEPTTTTTTPEPTTTTTTPVPTSTTTTPEPITTTTPEPTTTTTPEPTTTTTPEPTTTTITPEPTTTTTTPEPTSTTTLKPTTTTTTPKPTTTTTTPEPTTTTTTPETTEQTTATPEPASQSTSMLALLTTSSYSVSLSNTLTSKSCNCRCIFHVNSTSLDEDIVKKVANLQSNLAVNKTALSKTKRRLTCAYDSRASSYGLGILAFIFLAFCFGAVIAADAQSVYIAYCTTIKKGKSRK